MNLGLDNMGSGLTSGSAGSTSGGGGSGGGKEELHSPGEVILKEIEIKNINSGEARDFKKIANEISIYENIFNAFLTGEVVVTDVTGQIDSLPIAQEEELKVEWKTPTFDAIKKKFMVYWISNRVPGRETAYSFTLHFITAEGIKNWNTRVSKSYKDKKIKDIVDDIFNEYLKVDGELEWEHEPSNEDLFSCVIPNWKPLDAINWVLSRAYSGSPQNSNFVFYETLDGEETPKFKISCISDLISQEPEEKDKLEYSPTRIPGSDEFNEHKDPEGQLRNVSNYSIDDTDKLFFLEKGMFFSRIIDHDILRKTIRTTDWKYPDKFKQAKHMFDTPLLEGDKGIAEQKDEPVCAYGEIPTGDSNWPNTGVATVTKLVPKHKYLFTQDEDDEGQDKIGGEETDWLAPKISRIHDIHALTVNVTTPGDSRRRVGKMAGFEIPALSKQQKKTGSTGASRDPLSDGKYLMGNIRHRISIHASTIGHAYQNLIILQRDSIPEEK